MKNIFTFFLFAIVLSFISCDYAPPNKHVLYSDDCGESWKLIPNGEKIPKTRFACEYLTTLPTAPMAGDLKIKLNFNGKVRVVSTFSYMYNIEDPVAFLNNARYLGKSNADTETDELSRFETAENIIIDKLFADIASELAVAENFLEIADLEFEDKIYKKISPKLQERGIIISNVRYVPEPDEQTRQAIDIATALQVYDAAGIKSEGIEIMKAKAGANKVIVQQTSPEKNDEE